MHDRFALGGLVNAQVAVFEILAQAIVTEGSFAGVLNAECHLCLLDVHGAL
jgi:hypothetical protein